MKLVFGVWNVPYGTDGTTTGDVARDLEKRYGIMQKFVEMNKKMIAKEVMEELLGAKRRRSNHPMDAISARLKQAISNKEFDGVLPGVPTKAATQGISTRFKSGKRRSKIKRGTPRPSFIDSGLYQGSIRVVLEDE